MASDLPVSGMGLLTRQIRVRPLATFAACVCAGAAVADAADLPMGPMAISALVLAAVMGLLKALGRRRVAALAMALGLLLGAMAVTHRLEAMPRVETRYDVRITGTVASPPEVDPDKKRLTCALGDLAIDGEAAGYRVRLYLKGGVGDLNNVEVGQRIDMTGHLWAPEGAANPHAFDFGKSLWRSGMAAYVTGKLSDAVLEDAPPSPARWLCEIRQAIARRIDELFPRNGEVAKALILGDRSELGEETSEAFRLSGAAHLLAISGMHVSVLAALVGALLGKLLPRRWAFLATLLALCAYAALTGLRASILRAVVMYAVLGFAPIAGRPSDGLTRLAAAFLLLFAVNPLYIGDAGFGMSFAACAGILLLAEPLARLIRLRPADARGDGKGALGGARRYLSGAICMTLAAQLATAPLVIGCYGSLPLLATLTNLAAVPLALAGYGASLAATALSFLWHWVGAALAFLADLALSLLVWLIRVCARLPLSTVSVAAMPLWLCGLYAAITVLASDLCRVSRPGKGLLLAALPACLCAPLALSALGGTGLTFTFLDAGQADAAVIRAQGSAYMIDVGGEDTPAGQYLSGEGLRLKALFLTHPHDDHVGGLAQVLSVCEPEIVYIPAGWYGTDADWGVDEDLDLAEAIGADVVTLSAGEVVALSEEVTATVLHPEAASGIDDANALSMVLWIRYGDGSALFMGDLPTSAELPEYPNVDLLKVAHHGSSGSSSPWLISAASPALAVISVGENSYGHPAPSVVALLEDAGAKVYRTDQSGAVSVRMLRTGEMIVSTYR